MRSRLFPSFGGYLAAAALAPRLGVGVSAAMTVGNFTDPVTIEEIDSFDKYITTLTPAPNNTGNVWVQGTSGEWTKAMGLVYLISGNQATLDQMIRFCDAVLSERNDIAPAPTGQYVIWTGGIDPTWPNDVTTDPLASSGGDGDPVGRLASCANLILKTPMLAKERVTIGDPYGFGATYAERAQAFLEQADYSMSHHILSRLLNLTDNNRMYFASDSAYKAGDAVPWNQQMMFNYAFQNLSDAHHLLGDNATLAATYKDIMDASLAWFFTGRGFTKTTDTAGNTVYDWNYAPDTNDDENSNHGALDAAGFAQAYITGEYAAYLGETQMKALTDVFVDVMTINDTAGSREYAGSFRPDAYESMVAGALLTEGGTTTAVDTFSRFLWVKDQLNPGDGD
ncbi:hypothetical protein BX600DRAFT_510349 [Xylariales sp. PMI_506]|nr:hypothetical protein BX600DRAFT_510349 [Xylariales sp. PMI_506]